MVESKPPPQSVRAVEPGNSESLTEPDFELEFYKLHRAHEVALNSATATYEQSILRLVLVLNAASIGAFLGLMNIGKESLITYDVSSAKRAIYCWAAGIAAAFISTACGYWSQRALTRAYRYRRQAVEARKITNKTDAEDVFSANLAKVGLELGNGVTRSNISENLGQKANKERHSGENWQKASIGFGILAAILAVIGFGIAISAVNERSNGQPPAPAAQGQPPAPVKNGSGTQRSAPILPQSGASLPK